MPVESVEQLHAEAVALLKRLISTPSFSREEEAAADLIEQFLRRKGFSPQRQGNNVWCRAENCPPDAPQLLLNSHHDTVRPASGWTKDPFTPLQEEDVLWGLGSNDAGASAVALLAAFCYLSQLPQLPYRLLVAITAEEEISGQGGIASLLPQLGDIALAIVGEPTLGQLAIAEKGLMVLDCLVRGQAGHAARDEGENALYKALPLLEWFRTHQFPKVSPLLGPVKMSVTQIQAGQQHNVVPDECRFVVDVRTNECYQNEELLALIRQGVSAEVTPRSTRLNSSGIASDHPLLQRAREMGLSLFGSPTLSDQALMPFPSVKIGPGDSARSHTADEYIRLSEIRAGIQLYIDLLQDLHL
ncbi:M20 family metallo-hydrolase [Cesiribacter andamanensis]|uniref:Succinyl-diaminopimelate desuccinylase n=1 Tax=Cesiribacter andamanensis AMV16 TaxID=1279009 RepID=M7NAW6_9BACT|nr:M20 family metallo-hydrolase [Cesiribacter andamanensis]EMR04412.1 Succinyl-diaminopimelate desuccinylase [Cesiribacter andamanensis AMV16]